MKILPNGSHSGMHLSIYYLACFRWIRAKLSHYEAYFYEIILKKKILINNQYFENYNSAICTSFYDEARCSKYISIRIWFHSKFYNLNFHFPQLISSLLFLRLNLQKAYIALPWVSTVYCTNKVTTYILFLHSRQHWQYGTSRKM